MRQEQEWAQVTLQSIGDAVITTDQNGLISELNAAAEQLTAWSAEKAIGQPIEMVMKLVQENSRAVLRNPVRLCLRERRVLKMDNQTLLVRSDRSEIPIENSAAPIFDRQNKIIGAVMVFHDVSQQRELRRELTYQAQHDALPAPRR